MGVRMGLKIVNDYELGDMRAVYLLDEERQLVELLLLPEGKEILPLEQKQQNIDPLIQLKMAGDVYTGSYAGGATMHQSESCYAMKYQRQESVNTPEGKTVRTFCRDDRGYETIHTLVFRRGERTLRSTVSFTNQSNQKVVLEKLDSFNLCGITPFAPGDAHGKLKLHRIRSVWSAEGRLESLPLEDLQLEPSWSIGHAVRCERFGGIGSLPVNRFFPYAVIEDTENHIFWGAQIAHNASWQMEVFRRDEAVSMSGGLADRDFGHWKKEVAPGETFTTPESILTVAADDDLDRFSCRMTSAQERKVNAGPDVEQELPILFNEYCTTWGNPSHENISEILKAIEGKGFTYFVIDCGWFKEDGVPWDVSMGDYVPSKTLFPKGLEKTTEAIRKAGMKPGIWFEIDNVGSRAHAYQETDRLLTRDGKTLTTQMRRFWDMRRPEVIEDLAQKVIGTLQKYGFEYMKMDYNDTIGIGCDGAESLGEGLRQNMQASYDFIQRVKREIPGIILENCASGGHKLEPLMMEATAMASFSDAHECREIPIIAANLHRVILPRQSQIWAVIRETDDLRRIGYSMTNTFLGRMCLSGDVTHLEAEQWEVITAGIAFYKKVAPIIKNGVSYLGGRVGKSWRHPEGYQTVLRKRDDCREALVVIHTFDGDLPEIIEVDLGGEGYCVADSYSDTPVTARICGSILKYCPRNHWKGAAFYLRIENENI